MDPRIPDDCEPPVPDGDVDQDAVALGRPVHAEPIEDLHGLRHRVAPPPAPPPPGPPPPDPAAEPAAEPRPEDAARAAPGARLRGVPALRPTGPPVAAFIRPLLEPHHQSAEDPHP